MKTLILMLFMAFPALAQVKTIPVGLTPQMTAAFQIAIEGDVIESGPPSAIMQAGVPGTGFSFVAAVTTWPQAITWANSQTLIGFGLDPDQWVAKQLFVQQTTTVQTFTVLKVGATTPITVTVPAIVPGTATTSTDAAGTTTLVIPQGATVAMKTCYVGLVGSTYVMFAPQVP